MEFPPGDFTDISSSELLAESSLSQVGAGTLVQAKASLPPTPFLCQGLPLGVVVRSWQIFGPEMLQCGSRGRHLEPGRPKPEP